MIKKVIILLIVVTELIENKYGRVQLTTSRDQNGDFSPALIAAYERRNNHL